MRITTAFIIFCCLALAATPVFADEIHLKDGRVIKARVSWEAGNLIKYEKFGAVMGVEKHQVKYIMTKYTQKYKDATVYLDNGSDLFCKLILQHQDNVDGIDCIGRETNTSLKPENVLAIMEGPKESHKFLDLPAPVQKRWGAATVYLHNGEVLKASKLQQFGDIIVCMTYDDQFDIAVKDIKDIRRGHHNVYRSGHGAGERRLIGRKEKLRRLEEDIDKMLQEERNRPGNSGIEADWVDYPKPKT